MRLLLVSFSLSNCLALDVGRKFVGVAISDNSILKSIPVKTLILESGNQLKYPIENEFEINENFYKYLTSFIKHMHVKGVIIGYPTKDNLPVS